MCVRRSASNYANLLNEMQRFQESKALFRKTIPVARRVLGEGHRLTLKTRWVYSEALYKDDGATLDDLCEAVLTLKEIEPTARRVLGGAHPVAVDIEKDLRAARATLSAREAGRRVVFEYT